ncbi:MAG: HAD family hydrolase [Rhodobacteraceae bacterium]|jgi:putative hydrolase of the HAD superfamily|nr:HAD family hydrolase [Paracoccaceae bacterium]
MVARVTVVGFDADDTLWHNERFFQMTQERFAELLEPYYSGGELMPRLIDAERRNIGHYGFGIKGFVLSMIETALEVTDETVPAPIIGELIRAGQEMLRHPIELLPRVQEVIEEVSSKHRILLITKGDLLDQERKLAQSGLGDLFDGVEIVSDKTASTYLKIFGAQDVKAGMMVGNSLKSDVLPMISAGGFGVHVPHELTWALEHAERPDNERFFELTDLGGLPELLRTLE